MTKPPLNIDLIEQAFAALGPKAETVTDAPTASLHQAAIDDLDAAMQNRPAATRLLVQFACSVIRETYDSLKGLARDPEETTGDLFP